MRKKTGLCYVVTLVLLACLPSLQTSAQITIGSLAEPIDGAVLDLKEDIAATSGAGGVTATRGLGLPRVKLESVHLLKMGDNSDAVIITDPVEKRKHAGLLVYNISKRERIDRLCPGLHVWTGEEWKPIQPYPQFVINEKAGPTADLVDTRNNGNEVITYRTARFHSLDANRFSCDANTDVSLYVEAGIWMTENLRTKYLPGGNAEFQDTKRLQDLASAQIQVQSLQYSTTSATANVKNGYLYNWAATTVIGKNPITQEIVGKGGSTGKDCAGDEGAGGLKEIAQGEQGICPPGWHVPSDIEWSELERAVAVATHLYSSKSIFVEVARLKQLFIYGAVKRGTHSNAMLSADQDFGTYVSGFSNIADQGGFAVRLAGTITGVDPSKPKELEKNLGHFWTYSSSADGTRARSRTFVRSMVEEAPVSREYTALRQHLMSVRCKKNDLDD